ncbi:MAG: tellurite resistance-related uncharacterized protein [Acidimicrobiales bacterium]|jgi:tellurite resistance-related uncharacterized protein
MTARALPLGVLATRATPSFTDKTVPAALRNAHHTAVWAELVVEQGAVLFVEEQEPRWQVRVVAGASQAIAPNRKHHVEPEPGAHFHVQFYKQP